MNPFWLTAIIPISVYVGIAIGIWLCAIAPGAVSCVRAEEYK